MKGVVLVLRASMRGSCMKGRLGRNPSGNKDTM